MSDKPDSFGVFTVPRNGSISVGIKEGRLWACDNGAYTGFNEKKFLDHLDRLREYQSTCLFVVAPDVVGDALATINLYATWYQRLKTDNWSVAFVAQDGQESLPFPEFDWLFIGGTTSWKLGIGALTCIDYAHSISKPIHVGRVNSWRRYQYFKSLGVDTCDGTHPIYEPDKALSQIASWTTRPYNLSLFSTSSKNK